MRKIIKLDYKYTTLNPYINAERTNRYKAAKIKRDETYATYMMVKGKPKINTPCGLEFIWTVTSRRGDVDNIAFSKKFIIDGMVKAGIIPDDSIKHITGLRDRFVLGKKDSVMIIPFESEGI